MAETYPCDPLIVRIIIVVLSPDHTSACMSGNVTEDSPSHWQLLVVRDGLPIMLPFLGRRAPRHANQGKQIH